MRRPECKPFTPLYQLVTEGITPPPIDQLRRAAHELG